MFEYNQWVLYNGKPARVGHYRDDKYLIHIPIPHGFDHIKVQPSEITAVDVPEFNIGTTVLYIGKDIPSLKHELNQQYIVVGKNGHNSEIVTLVDIVRDVCFVRNQQGETFQTNPFEINRFNY